ncbi:hypothetical protein Tco_0870806 [Tanacetum coccineum]
MAAIAMKHMASSFAKLEKFEGVDFRRWQKKMHFMLSSLSVVYVLTALMLDDGGENPTVEQVRKRAKWDNDDYVYRDKGPGILGEERKLLLDKEMVAHPNAFVMGEQEDLMGYELMLDSTSTRRKFMHQVGQLLHGLLAFVMLRGFGGFARLRAYLYLLYGLILRVYFSAWSPIDFQKLGLLNGERFMKLEEKLGGYNLEEESDFEAVFVLKQSFGDSLTILLVTGTIVTYSAPKEDLNDPFISRSSYKTEVEGYKSDNSISQPQGFTPVNEAQLSDDNFSCSKCFIKEAKKAGRFIWGFSGRVIKRSVGSSGGILCVWDPIFSEIHHTISDILWQLPVLGFQQNPDSFNSLYYVPQSEKLAKRLFMGALFLRY